MKLASIALYAFFVVNAFVNMLVAGYAAKVATSLPEKIVLSCLCVIAALSLCLYLFVMVDKLSRKTKFERKIQ